MQQIDKELREAIVSLVQTVAAFHPQVRTNDRPKAYECTTCARVDAVMSLLEAEQREYGPPIDLTDPSWLREHLVEAPAMSESEPGTAQVDRAMWAARAGVMAGLLDEILKSKYELPINWATRAEKVLAWEEVSKQLAADYDAWTVVRTWNGARL